MIGWTGISHNCNHTIRPQFFPYPYTIFIWTYHGFVHPILPLHIFRMCFFSFALEESKIEQKKNPQTEKPKEDNTPATHGITVWLFNEWSWSVGLISAVFSSPVFNPPEKDHGRRARAHFLTAAGNRAYGARGHCEILRKYSQTLTLSFDIPAAVETR